MSELNFPVFKVRLKIRRLFRTKTAYANAILIDRANGIFLTNAHVAAPPKGYTVTERCVYLPHIQNYQKVESNERWINKNADLAYFRLPENLAMYPEIIKKSACVKEREKIYVIGYMWNETTQPIVAKGRVVCIEKPFSIDYAVKSKSSCMEPHDQAVFYDKFIFIDVLDRENFVPGMSGSAVVDQEGRLVGILSQGSGHGAGLATPVDEFDAKCVFSSPQTPKNTSPSFLKSIAGKIWYSGPS